MTERETASSSGGANVRRKTAVNFLTAGSRPINIIKTLVFRYRPIFHDQWILWINSVPSRLKICQVGGQVMVVLTPDV